MRLLKRYASKQRSAAMACTAIAVLGLAVGLARAAGETPQPPPAKHWAFIPPIRSNPPATARPAAHPIDRFILAELEKRGVEPAPQADRNTLIRRLSLDLLGLPPTIHEIDEFLNDSNPDAYERLVDRFLNSPRYGERWGRHWLDLARYADSNGYTIDGARSIWKYRDWVIHALNQDMPFDQFTVEQIAGDMLPNATRDQIIATGFHRNTQRNEEGGTDPEQYRVEAVADRVNTTGTVFLGLTLGCARCHDHKYDPISQREYFQVFALLNNADEPTYPVPTTQQSKEEPALVAEIAEAEKRLAMVDENSGGRLAEWERLFAGRTQVDWSVLEPQSHASAGGATITRLDDRSLLVGGSLPEKDRYTLEFALPEPMRAHGITALRLETLTHDSLPANGPGLAANGNFVLSELKIALRRTAPPADSPKPPDPAAVPIASATADHSQDKYPIAAAFDGKSNTGWAINLPGGVAAGPLNVDRAAEFVFKEPVQSDTPCSLVVTLEHDQAHYALGRFRISIATAEADVVSLPAAVREALAVAPDQRDDAQAKRVRLQFQTVDRERQPIAARVQELKDLHKQLKAAVTTTLVMQERKQPRETFVHVRGDFLRPGERVQPAAPAILPAIRAAGDHANRLDLARWLVDPANPLTARVVMNRLWQQYFGAGLVATENDFGTQGTPPTHPQLLDWLACEFMSQGWSLKAMHRLIVTSATYRQSSQFRPELIEVDPTNKWLPRQVRMRLEAEVIRDVGLAAAGLLCDELGGPGSYPPQPAGIYRFTQVAKFWKEPDGSERYRRGLYVYFWRSSPYPFLTTFDAPDANVACTRRVRSNTPLQALTLANDRAFVEIAQGLASRVLMDGPPSDPERIRYAFRACVSREPTEHERDLLSKYLADQRTHFEADQTVAQSVAASPLPPGSSAAEAAAWTALARVLINLDEFITRE